MEKDSLPDACGNELCTAWGNLIFSKDRGAVYEFFKRKQAELIQHLETCDTCPHFLVQIEPMPTMLANMEQFKSLNPRDFAVLIREIFTNAKAKGFGDDDNEDRDPIC